MVSSLISNFFLVVKNLFEGYCLLGLTPRSLVDHYQCFGGTSSEVLVTIYRLHDIIFHENLQVHNKLLTHTGPYSVHL
jgi:hypothetical protein